MRERLFLLLCLQSAGSGSTLFHGSRFQEHACDHGDDLLGVTASQRLAIGRIGRKALRPVQVAAQPSLSFFDPIHHAIHAGFSGQFPQHQHGQQQGQRIAFAFLPSSISHLLECTIQGGRIAAQGFSSSSVSTLKYAKVHVCHFSLSLGAFWVFPSIARNGSLLGLFGYTKQPWMSAHLYVTAAAFLRESISICESSL